MVDSEIGRRAEPVLGECPSWCDLPAGHDWEDEWTEGLMREHVHLVDLFDPYNAIFVREREIASDSGVSRQREVFARTESDGAWSPEEAARVAAAFTLAAQIAGAVCTCTRSPFGEITCRHFDCPEHGDEHHAAGHVRGCNAPGVGDT